MVCTSRRTAVSLALRIAAIARGIATARITRMIAITIRSSTSEKPRRRILATYDADFDWACKAWFAHAAAAGLSSMWRITHVSIAYAAAFIILGISTAINRRPIAQEAKTASGEKQIRRTCYL